MTTDSATPESPRNGLILFDHAEAQELLLGLLAPLPADSAVYIVRKRNDEDPRQELMGRLVDDAFPTRINPTENIWFGTVLRHRNATNGTRANLTWASCLWADFDGVADKDALVEKYRGGADGVPAPTFIVDSGGGLHFYWRLDRLLDMRSEAEYQHLRELIYGLACRLGSDATVHDPTPIMRLPGTYNPGNGKTKVYATPRPVTILVRP
jgi:hypothetical protein